MARAKTKTIKHAVETQPVRFAMNVGILVLEPKDHSTVMVDGGVKEIKHGGLTLERDGMMREFPFTRLYDPMNHDDLTIIQRVREHIEKNPSLSGGRVGLRVVPFKEAAPPIDTWNTMSAEAISSFVETTGRDLFECMNYELSKDEPRDDVVEALEKLNDSRERKAAADADVKVAL